MELRMYSRLKRRMGMLVFMSAFACCGAAANTFAADSDQAGADKPSVLVAASIRPLALIAEEILSPVRSGAVAVIVPQGASPHGFSLQPSDMRLVVSAPVLLWLGDSLEPYLGKALRKRATDLGHSLITADRLDGMKLLPPRAVHQEGADDTEGHHHHDHHHDHDHSAGQFDPHLWWHSANARLLAKALVAELSARYPQWEPALTASLEDFTQRLDRQRASILSQRPVEPRGFLNYHDSLLYLENELGLSSQRRITQAPEDKPSVRDMLELTRSLTDRQAFCVITEPGVNPGFLNKLNARGNLREVMVDPLGWDATSYSDMWMKGASALLSCSGAN